MKKINLKLILALILTIILSSSCSKEKEVQAKPISEIQKEKGIPVKTVKLAKSNLEIWKDYPANLMGEKQIKVFGMLPDKLEQIKISTGDEVKKDQVLASYSISNPKAKYKQAKIQFETVEKTYLRMKKVYESGGISKQKLDEIKAKYDVSQENLNAIDKMVYIKAPIGGVVTEIYPEIGQMVTPSSPICKIAQINKLKAKVFVDENEINSLKKGQMVKVVWNNQKDKSYQGIIEKISLSVNPKERGFKVEIAIDNADLSLKPGLFVTVYINTFKKENILKVDRNAILKQDGKNFVFVAKDGIAHKKEISLGLSSGTDVELTAGVAAGEEIIVEGQTLVSDGGKIVIPE